MRRGKAGGRVSRGDGSADEERVCGKHLGGLNGAKNDGLRAVDFGGGGLLICSRT